MDCPDVRLINTTVEFMGVRSPSSAFSDQTPALSPSLTGGGSFFTKAHGPDVGCTKPEMDSNYRTYRKGLPQSLGSFMPVRRSTWETLSSRGVEAYPGATPGTGSNFPSDLGMT